MTLEKTLFDEMGKPAEIANSLNELQRNVRYFNSHEREYMEKYGGQWIAIVNEIEFAHHPILKRILGLLRETKVNSQNAYVQYVERESKTKVLSGALVSLPVGI